MVRSPRCAHAGAQPGSTAGSRGSAALAAAARLAQRRGEKATGGGAGGGGRQPQVPGRKFLQGGGLPSRQFPPPHPGNYFQPPPALSCTSRRTKPFLLGVQDWLPGKREESPPASVRGLELGPLGTTEVVGVTTGQQAASGCWTSGLGDTSTSERMACPPKIPVFIFDLFFIL